jgi:hypothetical protein
VPGPHDFAVRADVVRLTTPSRPSHPALNVRDDAYAPLIEAGRHELVEMICPTGVMKYFCEEDWTTQIRLKDFTKSIFSRTRFVAPFLPSRAMQEHKTRKTDLPVGQINRRN